MYGSIIIALLLASLGMLLIPSAHAQEPTLENILDTLGFTQRTLVGATPLGATETFVAGTYTITMWAEFAGYRDQNQLRWYPVGTSTFNLIFDGPDGVPPSQDMGYVPSPETTATKSFTSSTAFGLSLLSPDSQSPFYTETSRDADGQPHAKVYQSTTNPNLYFIGFENMGAASYSDFDYNDMVVSLELTQYYLTITSAYGSTTGQGWCNAGSDAFFSVSPTTVSGGTGIQYIFTGWSSSDPGGYTGPASIYSVTMTNAITETANWKTQYYLTVTSVYDTPTGAGWYDPGSIVTSSVTSPVDSGNYVCSGYTGTGSAPASGSGTSVTFTISEASSITWNWHFTALIGGEWAPITLQTLTPTNALQLLAPWIALALIAAATAIAGYRRLLKKHW